MSARSASRSCKDATQSLKGPFVDDHLFRKVAKANEASSKSVIKIWSLRSMIILSFKWSQDRGSRRTALSRCSSTDIPQARTEFVPARTHPCTRTNDWPLQR
jgi:hypothetical protein